MHLETTPLGPQPAFDAETVASRREQALDPSIKDAFLAHGDALANVDRLVNGGALCVTTGQQPGLFLGPLYTVYKALTAVALARALEMRLNRAVVPVFWVGGDDHDLAEANHCFIETQSSEIERLSVRERPLEAPLQPLYKELLGQEVNDAIAKLENATPETEFRPDVLRWVKRHYHPGQDFASAFAHAISELTGRFGLVIFRSTHHTVKKVAAPFIVRAIEQAAEIDSALATRTEELTANDQGVPVTVGDGATLAMMESSLGRDRLLINGTEYQTRRSGEQWTLQQIKQVAQDEPGRLSPNVLLRPVVESAILPTLAYVGGPGELAYLPQSEPVYAALDVEPQVAVARWSGRVIEPRVQRVLEKFAIAPHDLDGPEGQLEARLVKADIPPEAARAISQLHAVLSQEYENLLGAVGQVDPTLKKPVQAAGHNAVRALEGLEKRLVSHLKKKNEIVVQQLAKARRSLLPDGKPQERVLSIVPYLVRYGDSFLDAVSNSCTEWTRTLETATSKT